MRNTRANGFTLIELMIVVAVIAILSAVAYPAYTESVLKGRRAQARTALLELLQQQERYMTQRNSYLEFTNSNGTASPAAPFKTYSGDNPSNVAYYLSAGRCDPSSAVPAISECVRVIATPLKADTAVNVLSITSTGVKACTGTSSTSNFSLCWP